MLEGEHSVHAELNAVFNSKPIPQGSTIYITHTPSYYSILAILSANIKRIVYFSTKKLDDNAQDAIRSAYAHVEEFKGNLNWMRDHIKLLESLGIFC